ncbi:PREDICTED: uncharacterized protein LOC109358587 isoform X2 [Lupinus angustifolius]|uniref:uncharacterized protein LOC109358587 isoform X2 n=1 Tax=Lupinus angustifolius TaxID=3871 RepID=UPI00092E7817|nr:PREDICTED: uncharacterized protein LOC109358587 isoform X2 [Lupinus angustifolius]
MAKRSDFAQKLLDDLRLRKEQMGSSQRSNQSHQLPIDAYAYTKQTYRGSRNTKANEIVKSSRSQRSPNSRQVSNQIVPFGKGQNSDMSVSLAFAFENGAKLKTGDSIMGFLNQIKKGTMEFNIRERPSNLDRELTSTTHYPTLSPLQINEISKGALKLNQILRACSNGLNMDTYSLQFAKELLQGAIDLEDSLKMVVDLHNGSEFMITPHKKNRIVLLEDDNDDEDRSIIISEQKQLARPIFSFDKPSKHSQNTQQVGKAIYMQRPVTVTYSKEGRNSNAKTEVPNKRSSDRNAVSERKSHTMPVQSNTERGRIPNVIAKLMGLDNLPEKVDSGYNYKQKIEGNHTAKGSTKKTEELKNKQTENSVPIKNQKDIEALKMPATRDEKLMFGADKAFEKASIKNENHNYSSSQKNLIRESQKNGRKQDYTNKKEEKGGTVKGITNDLVLNNMLEQVHERSQVKYLFQEEKEINKNTIRPEKTDANKHIMNNEKKSRNNLGVQKPYKLSKNGSQEEKNHREQPRGESMFLETRPQGRSEMAFKNQLINPQKKQLPIKQATPFKKKCGENIAPMKLESSHYDNEDVVRDDASNSANEKVKEIINRKPGQISYPRDREFDRVKGIQGIKTLMNENPVHQLASNKIKNTRKQKVDMHGKIDQVLTRRNGITKDGKKQFPSLQEGRHKEPDKFNVLKEERVTMSKDADAHIISSSNDSVAEPVDVRSQKQKKSELAPMLYSSGGRELQRLQDSVALVSNVSHYEDVQSLGMAIDEGFKSGEVADHRVHGIHEDRMGINKHSQLQNCTISEISIQKPLTDGENCLKWILVMSQLFINTAEALFRLKIPLSVLQNGGSDNQDEGRKLILDCGYEVMKRKGIRQELKAHTYSNISISTMNVRSFDDLVRQLNKDMEKLKFYGRNRSLQVDVEDCLPKMLENDVYNKDPEIGCMWDLGWNDETFAFIEKYDLIRDTEKHILSVLLDEITGELLHIEGGLNITTMH